MNKLVTFTGKIVFDLPDLTRKHKKQASWKRTAMLLLPADICDYYAWFIYKRYGITLNIPIRGAHISFINDSLADIKKFNNLTDDKAEKLWESVKNRWHNKQLDINITPDVRTNGEHWWLVIPEEERKQLHDIRKELGLNRPFYGLHLSIGYANSRNIDQSVYIHKIIEKFGKEYN